MTHAEWVDANLSSIGEAVQRARKAAGLKQDELARDIGITRNALQNLESPKGRRSTLDVLTLILIARRLGVPPIELIYPAMADGEVEAWPGVRTTSFQAAQWFSGEVSASDIREDETTRNSNHRRVGLSRARARLRETLREHRRSYLESQLLPDSAMLSKEQAAQLISESERKLRGIEATMRQEGMTVNDG